MTAWHKKGSAVVEVVIAAAIVIFVILPVFSAVMEKYVLLEKSRMIRDAVDMTNISAYNALKAESLGKVQVDMARSEVLKIYEELLCANLNLQEDLMPKADSVAEGRVQVSSLELYLNNFPIECPSGVIIVRPTVHSCICVPVKPSLYRKVVLDLLGKEYIDVEVHVDSEIPVNN